MFVQDSCKHSTHTHTHIYIEYNLKIMRKINGNKSQSRDKML